MTLDQAATKPGPMGWGDPDLADDKRLDEERRQLYEAQAEAPVFFQPRPAKAIPPAMRAAIVAAHEAAGIEGALEDSIDLRLICNILFGETWRWPRQLIGSCVASGGMRAWGYRSMWEVAAIGDPEELLGRERIGQSTIMPFGPYNYGVGRRLANMRRGDGSYCSVHIKGFQRFGVVDCNTPQLHRIVGSSARDYPETQSTRLYRDFGSWRHLDTLQPYAAYPLLESEEVRSADRSKTALVSEYKPHMICSGWGFAPDHKHRDGFWVYRRRGSWSHNMTIAGWRKASDGREFVLVVNSWGERAHNDGEHFWIPADLYGSWLRSASCMTIGDIDLPDSAPAMTW